MAEVNSSVYGSSENWLKVVNYNANIEEKNRLKFVNYTNDLTDTNGSRVYKGVDAGTIVPDEGFNNSISYCGIGSELPLANLKISRAAMIYHYGDAAGLDDGKTYGDLIETDDIEQQDNVVNFAFSRIYTPSSFLTPGSIYLVNVSNDYKNCQHQRWSPDAITTGNAPDSGFTFYNNVTQYDEMVAQIPVKNTILVPYIYAMDDRTVQTPHTICVTPSEYFDTEGEDSYLDYPYVWSVGVQVYTKTRAEDQEHQLSEQWSAVQLNGLTMLNPSKIADGFKCDPDPLSGYPWPDDREPLGDILYYTYCVNNVSNIVPILGKITSASAPNVNCPVNGTQNEDASIYGPYGQDLFHGSKISNVAAEIWAGPTPDETYYSDPQEIWTNNHSRKYWTIEVTAQNADDFREDIRHATAGFGLFFVEDANDVSLPLDDEDMFLGYFRNHDGIGHGDYSRGEANRDQDQWNWDDMHDGEYDPDVGPSEDESLPDTNPILPSDPGFTTAGRGTACYAMTYLDIDEVMEDIFGSTDAKYKELVEGLAMFGSNPMNAFVSCKWYPFVFSSQQNSPVVLGSTIVNRNHQYNVIDSTKSSYYKFACGAKVKCDKNFVYSRRTKARLFLPFYGFYELPMNMVMSYNVNLEFHYNVPDEMAVWIISFGNKIYDFVECDPAIEIPLTGDNAREILLTKRQMAANAAVAIGSVVVSAVVGGVMGNMAYDTVGAAGGTIAQQALAGFKSAIPAMARGAAIGVVGQKAYNNIANLARDLGNLNINVPTHGASGATTMLNLPLFPYIQLYTNAEIEGFNKAEYKLKVGIACDKWCKTEAMPENSLLKTTGIGNMNTSGMEMEEAQELNAILQSGFYR